MEFSPRNTGHFPRSIKADTNLFHLDLMISCCDLWPHWPHSAVTDCSVLLKHLHVWCTSILSSICSSDGHQQESPPIWTRSSQYFCCCCCLLCVGPLVSGKPLETIVTVTDAMKSWIKIQVQDPSESVRVRQPLVSSRFSLVDQKQVLLLLLLLTHFLGRCDPDDWLVTFIVFHLLSHFTAENTYKAF